MAHSRQKLGKRGEDLVGEYLEQQGYSILVKNWHAGRYGEIDLIATQGDEIVFIEVKTRLGKGFGNPEEAVNKFKQEKLRLAAQAFILAHPQLNFKPRFDVAAVILDLGGEIVEFEHFKNAIG